jgi:Sec-independent protein translocase protein TatA
MLGMNEGTVIVVIGLVAALIFGAPKVIQWARALGTAKREYEDAKAGKTKAENEKGTN